MKISNDATLSTLITTADQHHTSKSKTIYSKDSEGIYTRSNWKLQSIAKNSAETFSLKAERGLVAVKAAIDREFGHLQPHGKFSDVLFGSLKERGYDFARGIKIRDLGDIQFELTDLQSPERAPELARRKVETEFGKLAPDCIMLKHKPGSYAVFKNEAGQTKIRFEVKDIHVSRGRGDTINQSTETEASLNSKNEVSKFEGHGRARQTFLDKTFSTTLPIDLGGVPDREGILEYDYSESYLVS